MSGYSCVLMDALFIGLLLWCSYSDIKKRIVSNLAIAALLCLGIAHVTLVIIEGSIWWQYPAALLFAVPFFIAWTRDGMGAGDVKLIAVAAFYMGLFSTLIAFALMVPILAVLMMRSWKKNKTIKGQIPFAPVAALGAVGAVAMSYLYVFIGK